MNILITGATGFIGRAILADLGTDSSHRVIALTRDTSDDLPYDIKQVRVRSIDGTTQYHGLLNDIDVIIHTAARVHQLDDTADTAYADYNEANVEGTLNLARQAAESGVKRFIFLSTIKVNGESTRPEQPFTAEDTPAPGDPYAITKYTAECGLLELSHETGIETVILRPPLVYGPGVKANFYKLMQLAHKGYPLPFGSVENKRSLVSIDNLVSLIRSCIDHPNAANKIFLVSDDMDISTSDLVRKIAASMSLYPRLIAIPKSILMLTAALIGKREAAKRLLGNLQVDITKTKTELDWEPVTRLDDAIRSTTRDYLQRLKQ
ncbi:MAG: SDR family oxidoreductase [Pseudomonadota bacterium]